MQPHYVPSLLDKLLGEGESARVGGSGVRFTLDRIKDAVARDIESLLNVHASFSPDELEAWPAVRRSLLTLGLPDLSALSMASDRDRARITAALRDALANHDRRLNQVAVSVVEAPAGEAGLRFTIQAHLRVHPHVEPVRFDAVLQPGSQRYEVCRKQRTLHLAAPPPSGGGQVDAMP